MPVAFGRHKKKKQQRIADANAKTDETIYFFASGGPDAWQVFNIHVVIRRAMAKVHKMLFIGLDGTYRMQKGFGRRTL